jgi:ComF family protein
VEKTWWGRMSVVAAMSQFYFTKNSLLQALIHQLKYKGNREIGLYFGKMIGYDLQASERFQSLEVLIPLPLFPDKEKKRGYNQATLLCEGIAGILNLPVATDEVQRVRATDTQTHKKRMERWENVETVFATRHSKSLENKNILLVDDVITTGATLEACGKAILEEIPGVQLSIATLAYADN